MPDVVIKKKEGLKQQAYRQLKSMILTHQLKMGSVVTEAHLQELLGIGRTPVREAILQLAAEHFVTIHSRHGIEIATISPKRIRDIFEIRSFLEPQILRQGMSRIDRNWLMGMRDAFSEYSGVTLDPTGKDTIKLSNLDNELHMGIVSSIDNYYSNELMAGFQDYLTLFRASSTIEEIRFGPSNSEHIAIIDAIFAEDIETACEILALHLTRSYEESIRIVMNIDI